MASSGSLTAISLIKLKPLSAGPHLQELPAVLLNLLAAAVQRIHDQGGCHLLLVEELLHHALQRSAWDHMCSGELPLARRRRLSHAGMSSMH